MKNTFESRLHLNQTSFSKFLSSQHPNHQERVDPILLYIKTKFFSDDHLNGLIQLLDIAPLNLMISEYSFRLELSSISGSICLTKMLRAEGIIAFYCC